MTFRIYENSGIYKREYLRRTCSRLGEIREMFEAQNVSLEGRKIPPSTKQIDYPEKHILLYIK